MDSSYLFDARPLAMTAAGKIQNYLAEEPKLWRGANGQRTLATRLVTSWLPSGMRFSIINGVLMPIGFDGHDQNINSMFSGSPFGGDWFIPQLNNGEDSLLLDTIVDGKVPGFFRNLEKTIPLSAESAVGLIEKNREAASLDPDSPLDAPSFGLECRTLDAERGVSLQPPG